MVTNTKVYRDKDDLRKIKVNLKRFYFSVGDSPKRGYNRRIDVFCLERKTGLPVALGYIDVNTASYKGDHASACYVIHKACGYRMTDGYSLDRKDVLLYQV
jgi:hypothetical protein